MQRNPRVGLLLAYHRCSNLGGIAHPKLVSQLGQHPFKPLRVAGCFHAYAHWFLESSVELLRLTVAMLESAFDEFAAFRIHHRNLLEARMKIYPYNQHTRLLSSESWSVCAAKFTRPGRSRRCYLINFTLLSWVWSQRDGRERTADRSRIRL